MPTQERLKELLSYDPVTGLFTWIGSSRHGWNGKIAGCAGIYGGLEYVSINVDGKHHGAHRLAILYMDGYLPDPGIEVDHWDRCGLNNRYANLRITTKSENLCNSKRHKQNKSGVKGVHQNKYGRWIAQIQFNKLGYYLGSFGTLGEAAEAVRAKRIELHGEFANHG